MNNSSNKVTSIHRAAIVLGIFALLCTALLTWVNQRTAAAIATSEHEAMVQQFSAIIARNEFDNDAINDCVLQRDTAFLGVDRPLAVYRFRAHGSPRALIIHAIAPDGYNGEIALLIGIDVAGTLAGVRVSAHHETAGLGDKIERTKSDWIESFKSLSLQNRASEKWRVKKDGGDFDAFTGATMTPRAVIKAVEKSLHFYAQHRESLFSLPANCNSTGKTP